MDNAQATKLIKAVEHLGKTIDRQNRILIDIARLFHDAKEESISEGLVVNERNPYPND